MKIPLIPDDSPFLVHETRRNRWAVPYHAECLNARINHLLAENLPYIEGKNILDAIVKDQAISEETEKELSNFLQNAVDDFIGANNA